MCSILESTTTCEPDHYIRNMRLLNSLKRLDCFIGILSSKSQIDADARTMCENFGCFSGSQTYNRIREVQSRTKARNGIGARISFQRVSPRHVSQNIERNPIRKIQHVCIKALFSRRDGNGRTSHHSAVLRAERELILQS